MANLAMALEFEGVQLLGGLEGDRTRCLALF